MGNVHGNVFIKAASPVLANNKKKTKTIYESFHVSSVFRLLIKSSRPFVFCTFSQDIEWPNGRIRIRIRIRILGHQSRLPRKCPNRLSCIRKVSSIPGHPAYRVLVVLEREQFRVQLVVGCPGGTRLIVKLHYHAPGGVSVF